MDLPNLAIVLKAALSPNPAERKAAEDTLNQVSIVSDYDSQLYVSIMF